MKKIMSSFAISSIVLVCVFGGAPLGMVLPRLLPRHKPWVDRCAEDGDGLDRDDGSSGS
jgi:hypothetical protein